MIFKKTYRDNLYLKCHGNEHESGIALVVVLMASAIAATTTMAVVLRSYSSYVNGTRQSLSDRAKEAAEAGLNIIIENLTKIILNG